MNCAAIPESLIESELFGYREGAFTGARSRGAKGKIAQADGGTLFLDEIGDMPLLLQSRLLRVLAEGEVLPLGAEEPVAVALQVVCATHQSLTDLVRQGRFREDLYYRLLGAVFHLPPLRDREDIGTIIRHLLDEECAAMGRPWAQLDREAMAFLKRCPWPGNIRQLRLAIRYACAISDGEWLSVADFPRELLDDAPANAAPTVAVAVAPAAAAAPAAIPCPTSADERQREDMLEALRRHKWRVGHAARELEVPRSTFYRRMAKLCIVPPNQA
jgi:transcriptional regulator of acetoin/glycerol metabolism